MKRGGMSWVGVGVYFSWTLMQSLAAQVECPAGAEAAAKSALARFLPEIEAAPANFGFQPGEPVKELAVELPLPARVIDTNALLANAAPGKLEDCLHPCRTAWAPVSLRGQLRGIVCITLKPGTTEWIPLDYGHAEVAAALAECTKLFPPPRHRFHLVLAPASPDVYVAIDGLDYDNLTLLTADPAALRRLLALPPESRAVLESIRARLSYRGTPGGR